MATVTNPGLHHGAAAIHVAANQEVRGRRLVTARAGVEKASLDGLALDALAGRGLIAGSVGSEAVVAIRDAHRHRESGAAFASPPRLICAASSFLRARSSGFMMRSISSLLTVTVRITWFASSTWPGVRWASGVAMAACTFAGTSCISRRAGARDRAVQSCGSSSRSSFKRALSRRPASSRTPPLLRRSSTDDPPPRIRRARPAACSSPSAESDRICDCGSGRTGRSARGRRGRWCAIMSSRYS